MHRWIQMPQDLVVMLLQEGVLSPEAQGYEYVDQDTQLLYTEFHVDDCELFETVMCDTQYGGNLSVRRDTSKKPVVCLGQDECIFKQFSFSPKSWTAPDGKKAIIPKDDGLGIMISAFVSGEFGLVMVLVPATYNESTKKDRVRSTRTRKLPILYMGRHKSHHLPHRPSLLSFITVPTRKGTGIMNEWPFKRRTLLIA